MKLVALLPVRDESDVIAQSLKRLLEWADRIYVYDTGSVDGTWEIVNDLAVIDKRVVPVIREPVYFSDTLVRRYLFEVARNDLRTGDWFARVDADEFHHVDPRVFIRERVGKLEGVIYHQYYDFCLLASEAERLATAKAIEDERRNPIEQRRRHYIVMRYAEPRFCRYRETMRWGPDCSFPFNAGFVARARIPIRHYPRRDPLQLAKRCALRSVMIRDPVSRQNWRNPEEHHWWKTDWKQFVTPDAEPGLRRWQPGEELPEVRQQNHLKRGAVRAVQYVLHRYLVRWVDRFRPLDGLIEPMPIQDEVQARIVEAYRALEDQWK